MLDVSWATIRATIHILSVSAWLGSLLILLAVVPIVARSQGQLASVVARRTGPVAAGSLVLLVLTGIFSLRAADRLSESDYRTTVIVKLIAVAIAGALLYLASVSTTAGRRNQLAGASVVLTVLAVFLGVQMHA